MSEKNKSALVTLIVGLALNIILGVSKLVVGLLCKSVSVSSDAFNNLSDAAVSLVSIIAVAVAARAADHDHPYGHGRYEYIATFILGAVIFAVGIEVFITGVRRAINPEPSELGLAVWLTLGISIGIKTFMGVFYTARSRGNGGSIKAAAADSFSDVGVTAAVLVCAVIQYKTDVYIDGYVSIAIAPIIVLFAVRILKGVMGTLIGARDVKLEERVRALVARAPHALSMHDLIINDYGADNKIAEVDVVYPCDMSFIEVHDAATALEKSVLAETGVKLCVHADPFVTTDERLVKITERLASSLAPFGVSAHDAEIDDENGVVSLDVLLPGDKVPVEDIKSLVAAEVKSLLGYDARIGIDYT